MFAIQVLASLFLLIVVNSSSLKYPTVVINILVKNKAHYLPYFFNYLEKQDYDKSRIGLWLRVDSSVDESEVIVKQWLNATAEKYAFVNATFGKSDYLEKKDEQWPVDKFRYIIKLRQESFEFARQRWADYAFFLDSDVLLVNNQTLRELVYQNKLVVSPKLDSLGMYSNFWCGMQNNFYYQRTDEYKPILERKNKGCHKVILVNTCILVDLTRQESDLLTFDPDTFDGYDGPIDDMITFAISAYWRGLPIHVLNEQVYGFIPVPLEDGQGVQDDINQLEFLKLEVTVEWPETLAPAKSLEGFVKVDNRTSDKMGYFDEIFLINLDRRPDRLKRMEYNLDSLKLNYTRISAVDGRTLNDSVVDAMGIKILPHFADPYHKRPMTMGEIGCFLSHYNIWKEIVEKKIGVALIFEDDIRFEPYFTAKLRNMLDEARDMNLDWDLIYLGRKRLRDGEKWVEGAKTLSHVEYTYWTLSYMITLRGAEKLLAGEPLLKLVPVDEYLPIMFDKHPEEEWSKFFPTRNLKAYSAAPLLVYPQRYIGEDGYISDTEDSAIVDVETLSNSTLLEDKCGKKGSKEDLEGCRLPTDGEDAVDSLEGEGKDAEKVKEEL